MTQDVKWLIKRQPGEAWVAAERKVKSSLHSEPHKSVYMHMYMFIHIYIYICM